MVHKPNGVNGTHRFPCKTCGVGTVTAPDKICGACEIDGYATASADPQTPPANGKPAMRHPVDECPPEMNDRRRL